MAVQKPQKSDYIGGGESDPPAPFHSRSSISFFIVGGAPSAE
jgi:hypothetical protein